MPLLLGAHAPPQPHLRCQGARPMARTLRTCASFAVLAAASAILSCWVPAEWGAAFPIVIALISLTLLFGGAAARSEQNRMVAFLVAPCHHQLIGLHLKARMLPGRGNRRPQVPSSLHLTVRSLRLTIQAPSSPRPPACSCAPCRRTRGSSPRPARCSSARCSYRSLSQRASTPPSTCFYPSLHVLLPLPPRALSPTLNVSSSATPSRRSPRVS